MGLCKDSDRKIVFTHRSIKIAMTTTRRTVSRRERHTASPVWSLSPTVIGAVIGEGLTVMSTPGAPELMMARRSHKEPLKPSLQ